MPRTVTQLFDLTCKTALVTSGPHGPGLQLTQALGACETLEQDKPIGQAPPGRLGDSEGLKGFCLLLASDAGRHIAGQWLAVDSGVSAMAED